AGREAGRLLDRNRGDSIGPGPWDNRLGRWIILYNNIGLSAPADAPGGTPRGEFQWQAGVATRQAKAENNGKKRRSAMPSGVSTTDDCARNSLPRSGRRYVRAPWCRPSPMCVLPLPMSDAIVRP